MAVRKVPQMAPQEEKDYCPLCGGVNTLELPKPIPLKFRAFVRELCPPLPGHEVPKDKEDWQTVTCACAVHNNKDFAYIAEYAWAYSDLTACYLGTATDQQWFRVCVTASDLPSGEVVQKWAARLKVSMDNISW